MSLSLALFAGSALADNGEAESPGDAEEAAPGDEAPEIAISIANMATADFDRTYHWDLGKSGELVQLVEGDKAASAELRYTVTATPAGFTDPSAVITGEVTITRGGDGEDSPVSVTLDGGHVALPGGANATCEYRAPKTRPTGLPVTTSALPGQDTVVTYTCDVDGEIGAGQWAHTITGTWNVTGGPFDDTDTANISTFENADETVIVLDDKTEADGDSVKLGEAHWNSDGMPAEFDYTVEKGGLELGTCTDITNTAWIEGTEISDSATVEVCPEAVEDSEKPGKEPTDEPLTGSIGDVTRDVCEVTIPTELSGPGEFGLEVWDDEEMIDEFFWTMEDSGGHVVTWIITRPALEGAAGVGFYLVDAEGGELGSVDPWEYPAEVAQHCYEATGPAPTPEGPAPSGPSADPLPDTGVNSANALVGAGFLAALGAALILARRAHATRR